jgi:hypothetical protein
MPLNGSKSIKLPRLNDKYGSWAIYSGCPSDPMNIIIWIFWRINLYNKMNEIKIYSSGNNICG